MSATQDRNNDKSKSKSPSPGNRFSVKPKQITTGEIHTLGELAKEFPRRTTMKLHDFADHQVLDFSTDSEELARFIEFILIQQRGRRECLDEILTTPTPAASSLDGCWSIESWLFEHPLKWDQQTGREPQRMARKA